MKIKKVFITLALTQLCAILAFSQTKKVSAKDLLSQGIAAEQKGDNIQALTLFIQAYTADRKLADAEKRMWNSLEIVRFGNFNSSFNKETQSQNPAELIKLRNDWDKLFEATAKFIESNPPKFGLAYNDNPEICDIDYTNGTVSVSVDAPFLYELYEIALPNQKLVDVLKFTLEHIEKHENWGDKINNFPWTYLKQLYRNEANSWIENLLSYRGHEDKYNFIVSLLSDNKKIASEKISRTIFYSKQLANFSLNIGETDKEDNIVFNNIPIDNINSENLHLTIEKSSIPICLTNVLDEKYKLEKWTYYGFLILCNKSVLRAMDKIDKIEVGKTETVKIIGYCGDVFTGSVGFNITSDDRLNINYLREIAHKISCSKAKFVNLDLSDAIGVKNINFDIFEHGYHRVSSITLPDSLLSIENFSKSNFKNLKEINFCGSEELWNQIIKYSNCYPKSFDGIQINFNYEGENS